MNKKTLIGSAIIVGGFIAAGVTYATKHTEKLATVGDHVITKKDYTNMISDLGIEKSDDVDPTILTQMVEQYLLSSAAKKNNLSEKEDVVRKINFTRNMVLRDAYIMDFLEKNISDEKIKAEYTSRIENLDMPQEYHAAHILVKEEETAKKIAQEINDKSNFADFAKKYSIGPTGENGGDLGFFTLDMMVQPFSDAVEKLKVGEVSAPTKTNFGWHIIKLIDKKQKAKPSFETLKESIRAELSQSSMLAHIADLKTESKVEYHIDMPADKNNKDEAEK